MRNFLRIADGVDVVPALNALALHPDLWNENRLRTQHPGTAHAAVDDIWLLFNEIPADSSAVVDDVRVGSYRAWPILHPVRQMALDIMHRVGGVALGRVLVTRLAPGKSILPHTDQGAPATYFARYQIALQSLPGALFRIENETVNFRSGEVWLIDNAREHEVVNNSADDRIVVIADVRVL